MLATLLYSWLAIGAIITAAFVWTHRAALLDDDASIPCEMPGSALWDALGLLLALAVMVVLWPATVLDWWRCR